MLTLASTFLLIIDDILVYILIFDVSAAVALGNERRDEIGQGGCQVQNVVNKTWPQILL